MLQKDPYVILGVTRAATVVEIKKAYRVKVKQYHPDVNQGNASAEEKFKEVQEAFDMIMNPQARRRGSQPSSRSSDDLWDNFFNGDDIFGEPLDVDDLLRRVQQMREQAERRATEARRKADYAKGRYNKPSYKDTEPKPGMARLNVKATMKENLAREFDNYFTDLVKELRRQGFSKTNGEILTSTLGETGYFIKRKVVRKEIILDVPGGIANTILAIIKKDLAPYFN